MLSYYFNDLLRVNMLHLFFTDIVHFVASIYVTCFNKDFGFCKRSETLVILFVWSNFCLIWFEMLSPKCPNNSCLHSVTSEPTETFVCVCVCGRTTCLAETLAQPPASCIMLYCPWERPSPVSFMLHVPLNRIVVNRETVTEQSAHLPSSVFHQALSRQKHGTSYW